MAQRAKRRVRAQGAAKGRLRVGEAVLGRPAHSFEQSLRPASGPHADQPIATIAGRRQHRAMAPGQRQTGRDVSGPDGGNVGADNQHISVREGVEHAGHPVAESPAALWHPGKRRQHWRGNGVIGGHREDGVPAPVGGKPSDRGCDVAALKRGRPDIADIRGQARLHPAHDGGLGHDDQHRPACDHGQP